MLGVATEVEPTLQTDVATKLTPFEPRDGFVTSVEDTVRSWTYPPLNSLEVHVYRSGNDPGFIAIRVPPTPNLTLVRRGGEAGATTSGVLLPERVGGAVSWRTMSEIHGLIRGGLRFDAILAQVADRYVAAPARNEAAQDQWKRAIEQDEPALVIQLAPLTRTDFANLYDTNGIRGSIDRYYGLRQAGFNLNWLRRVDIRHDGGSGLVARHPIGWQVWVDRRGNLTVRMPIHPNALGWVSASGLSEIVLFEQILETARFFQQVVWENVERDGDHVRVRIALDGDVEVAAIQLRRNLADYWIPDEATLVIASPDDSFTVDFEDSSKLALPVRIGSEEWARRTNRPLPIMLCRLCDIRDAANESTSNGT